MILDPACGSKMFWFDKSPDGVVFGDVRRETHTLCDGRKLVISPDVQLDYTALPFSAGQFDMVVFDPPHLHKLGLNTWMAKKYGVLGDNWENNLKLAFSECLRVLKTRGTFIFKWSSIQIPVSKVLSLATVTPMFGHPSGKNGRTHWLCFIKDVT